MDYILEWGISLIQAIQTARSPLLDRFFEIVTELGSGYFYFAALPIICTAINRTIGMRIAFTILVSVALNSLIKNWVAEPRPFELLPSVGVITETGFGFPSGHAQQAALFWGLVFFYARTWWVALLGATLVGLIGLSRIYLGVHYPTDVLGGIAIASFFVLTHGSAIKMGSRFWQGHRRFLVFGFALSLAVFGSILAPEKDMISGMGLGCGLLCGLLIATPLPSLSPHMWRRLVVAGLTAVVLLGAFFGLKFLFPKITEPNYELFSFLRYFLCGFVLSAFPLWLDTRDQRRQLAREKIDNAKL